MPTFSHGLLSLNKLIDEGNWMFSGQVPGDKNLYIVKHGTNMIWLVCKRFKSISFPDWKVMHTSIDKAKDIEAALFSGASAPRPGASAPGPGATAPSPDLPSHTQDEPHSEPDSASDPIAASANRATDKETPALWHQRPGM